MLQTMARARQTLLGFLAQTRVTFTYLILVLTQTQTLSLLIPPEVLLAGTRSAVAAPMQ
jgi:hypothetical protein